MDIHAVNTPRRILVGPVYKDAIKYTGTALLHDSTIWVKDHNGVIVYQKGADTDTATTHVIAAVSAPTFEHNEDGYFWFTLTPKRGDGVKPWSYGIDSVAQGYTLEVSDYFIVGLNLAQATPSGTPLNAATTAARVIYWPSGSSGTKIQVKRSANDTTYAVCAEFNITDAAGLPVTVYPILDAGYYKVYAVNGETETQINASISDVLSTPDTEILRRVRRMIGELRDGIAVTDREIRYAYKDAVEDYISIDLGVTYSVLVAVDDSTGEQLPVGLSASGTITPPYLAAVALRTGMLLIENTLAAHSREAISADTPAGRINTTASPEALSGFLDKLTRQYEHQADRLTETSSPFAFMDTTKISTGRGYEEE